MAICFVSTVKIHIIFVINAFIHFLAHQSRRLRGSLEDIGSCPSNLSSSVNTFKWHPLKPLGWLGPNFICSILLLGDWKFVFNDDWLFSFVAMATEIFHWLSMGKIEKRHLLPSNCTYFWQYFYTFVEMFLEKSCISHIFLALWPLVLVAVEAIMRNMEKENT